MQDILQMYTHRENTGIVMYHAICICRSQSVSCVVAFLGGVNFAAQAVQPLQRNVARQYVYVYEYVSSFVVKMFSKEA